MKIELNALVTVRPRGTNLIIEGTVVKYQPCSVLENNGVVWITDVNGSQRKYFEGFDDIEVRRDLAAENIEALTEYLHSVYSPFDDIRGDGDETEVVYYCDRQYSEYTVVLSAGEYGFGVNTIHKGRKKRIDLDSATANEGVVKTMRGVKGYISRFI